MRFKYSLVLAAAAAVVNAQSETATSTSAAPTSTAGLSECLLTCVTDAAASAGCSSFADLECVCTSSTFQSEATSCLQTNCTAADLQAGLQLQQTECAAISAGSSVISAGSSVFSSISSEVTSAISSISSRASSVSSRVSSALSPSTATSSGTSTATSSGAALGMKVAFGPGTILSAVVGIFGIAAGALLV